MRQESSPLGSGEAFVMRRFITALRVNRFLLLNWSSEKLICSFMLTILSVLE
jgi:hypothetical protein